MQPVADWTKEGNEHKQSPESINHARHCSQQFDQIFKQEFYPFGKTLPERVKVQVQLLEQSEDCSRQVAPRLERLRLPLQTPNRSRGLAVKCRAFPRFRAVSHTPRYSDPMLCHKERRIHIVERRALLRGRFLTRARAVRLRVSQRRQCRALEKTYPSIPETKWAVSMSAWRLLP